MNRMKCLFFLMTGLSFFTGSRLSAQEMLEKRFADLNRQYRQHPLPDTVYLKQADSLAPLLINDDSLPPLLSLYQQIAFANPKLAANRAYYYTYMALYSYNRNRMGSVIYYSEKNNKERIDAGQFPKKGLSHSDEVAMSIYQANRDYPRLFARYMPYRQVIKGYPEQIAAGKLEDQNAYMAILMLQGAGEAAFDTRDTILGDESVDLANRILESMKKQPVKYSFILLTCTFNDHSLNYYREKYYRRFDQAAFFLQAAITDVQSKSFNTVLKNSSEDEIYMRAFDFYFTKGRYDSARLYLTRLRSLKDSLRYSMFDRTFFKESEGKLLAKEGRYKAAYDTVEEAFRMRDSAYYAVAADKDNNLYALAEADDARHQLILSDEKKRKSDQLNGLLFSLLGILVVGGVAGFFVYRSRQRQRLLDLQLSLARNFHDEIGPMMMYAGVLAKKESDNHPTPGMEDLKAQIKHITESVRGISHDLKSSGTSTVRAFGQDITHLLEKIKSSTGIGFTMRVNNGERVLSHLQYTHLRKIVSELITNSIKYAECSMIHQSLKVTERQLKITYSDNGKGMATQKGGIGIQNIRERVGMLKGEFQLHNYYPAGYSIDISIPLL